ncbi:MerR family transcriptional regulator, redox-sensitive transcriptional activator SoxR [Vibrio xiamenensis]|uniref:Redox-sensitive transcriptional activator SoxR n=1 Tax=Vibrio xiamenensis TaxID=861298 RepID=A0A1G7XBI6_9VIBR|nr:redox-sensitive transcriptional activator SoxR [Vibrio xiamenensis]SDG81602.1 MerR family transcriptional regulator, redox-sensitive transcriptional activator SoxR [Vibrio xiamenensis]
MELSVGEVAKRANVKVSALHFYEQKGLIFSGRNAGNQRRYERSVLRRVAVIKAAQQVGLTLEEISQAFVHLPKHQAPNKSEWQAMASSWHQLLERRIQALRKLQNSLGECIGCGCLSLERCALQNPQDKWGEVRPGSNLVVPSKP